MSGLKILFLPAWYPSEVNPVAGVFIREHARAVLLYNDVTVVYAYGTPDHKVRGLYEVGDAIEDGIRTVRLRYRSPSRRSYSALSRLTRVWVTLSYVHRLMKTDWKPDIIHAHVYSAGVPAVMLGSVYGLPVVITEHWSWFALNKLTWGRRLAARFVMKRARIVLPVSEHLSRQIQRYGVQGRFRIVPNVVDTRLFCLPTRSNRAVSGTKRLLLVANLSEQKGVTDLLHALRRVADKRVDFCLDIVGEGAGRQDYEKLGRELGLDSLVRFHGAKPKEGVAEFMKSCSFFVQPSHLETFGVVYIEAMACGKPVVAYDIPGPNEFINRDVGTLVPLKNIDALAKAIDFMLDNHGSYSPEKLAAHVAERFSYEVVGRKLDEVYREVIGE